MPLSVLYQNERRLLAYTFSKIPSWGLSSITRVRRAVRAANSPQRGRMPSWSAHAFCHGTPILRSVPIWALRSSAQLIEPNSRSNHLARRATCSTAALCFFKAGSGGPSRKLASRPYFSPSARAAPVRAPQTDWSPPIPPANPVEALVRPSPFRPLTTCIPYRVHWAQL